MVDCPMGGPKCPPSICDCFVDYCEGCANDSCPTGGIHPEFYVVGGTDG